MTARPLLPGMPLTPEHARQLEKLVETLSPEEALWISGYLAGFARQSGQPAAIPVEKSKQSPLLILYGSETGHAAEIAKGAEELARAKGLAVNRVDMADFKPQAIGDTPFLLVVTSTYGDGDPPVGAMDFFDFIQGRKAPRLEAMKFAVLGLGDSSYERFCQAAKDLDKRFEALGATRLLDRVDCDVDYEGAAGAWIEAAVTAFASRMQAAAPAPVTVSETASRPAVDQKHPFPATVLTNLALNGRGSDKETRHIELAVEGSGISWEPGDSLGVLPENDPALVEEIMAALDLKPDEPVPAGEGDMPLALALARHYEITTLTPRFIEIYGQMAGAEKLRALDGSSLQSYRAGRQMIDVVTDFPVRGLGGKAFLAMLRPQQPRLYSLASSPAAYPGEAHITVAAVRYETHGRQRKGVASNHLAEHCGEDSRVPIYISANRNFRLPTDPSVPIIMIGAGTGVAPFRAFLQHREAAGATGRNWLFFGDRRFRTDFLYQTEWQHLIKAGILSRMDVAFSRDQEEKIYVQHRLLGQGREVYGWLEEGACLYVCGDASHMAPDVHAALVQIVGGQGQMPRERAEEYLKQLQREKRYQRDVY